MLIRDNSVRYSTGRIFYMWQVQDYTNDCTARLQSIAKCLRTKLKTNTSYFIHGWRYGTNCYEIAIHMQHKYCSTINELRMNYIIVVCDYKSVYVWLYTHTSLYVRLYHYKSLRIYYTMTIIDCIENSIKVARMVVTAYR